MQQTQSPINKESANPHMSINEVDAGSNGQTMAEKMLFHPLFNKARTLPTLPINEVFQAARMSVLLNETGLVFTAHSGTGKTFAINMVRAMLLAQFPQLCIFTHEAHNHHQASVRGFFKHFLKTLGHVEQRGETADLRQRVSNILIDDARISRMNRVVLFVDEANAMLLSDFQFLKDVHNDLSKADVQLNTVLMGQSPKMENVIATLRRDGHIDLVNRFATRVLPMRGYDRLEDLTMILKGIDTSFYPEQSTVSWTAFFLPLACSRGFTLENEAPAFFAAISAGAPAQRGKVVFPARATFLAIRTFLMLASGYDGLTLQLPKELWANAVAHAKLQDAMDQVNARPPKKNKSSEAAT